jgi:hypothetical protein
MAILTEVLRFSSVPRGKCGDSTLTSLVNSRFLTVPFQFVKHPIDWRYTIEILRASNTSVNHWKHSSVTRPLSVQTWRFAERFVMQHSLEWRRLVTVRPTLKLKIPLVYQRLFNHHHNHDGLDLLFCSASSWIFRFFIVFLLPNYSVSNTCIPL